jgi:hypothetical protein
LPDKPRTGSAEKATNCVKEGIDQPAAGIGTVRGQIAEDVGWAIAANSSFIYAAILLANCPALFMATPRSSPAFIIATVFHRSDRFQPPI